jgi:hypothetical protein
MCKSQGFLEFTAFGAAFRSSAFMTVNLFIFTDLNSSSTRFCSDHAIAF